MLIFRVDCAPHLLAGHSSAQTASVPASLLAKIDLGWGTCCSSPSHQSSELQIWIGSPRSDTLTAPRVRIFKDLKDYKKSRILECVT